jgi:hypothetical protein
MTEPRSCEHEQERRADQTEPAVDAEVIADLDVPREDEEELRGGPCLHSGTTAKVRY